MTTTTDIKPRRSVKPITLVGILVYCALFYSVFFLDKNSISAFTSEDRLSEILGALFLFLSSILCFILFFRSRFGNDLFLFKTKKNLIYLGLALIFLFGAGEEMSWGQRILGFSTPESINSKSVQKEFNLHNLKFFHNVDFSGKLNRSIFAMTNIFTAFCLGFCLIIPLFDRLLKWFSGLRKRLGVPLVPLEIGWIFGLTYVVSKILKWTVLSHDFQLIASNLEIRESLWSFLFFVILVHWFKESREER